MKANMKWQASDNDGAVFDFQTPQNVCRYMADLIPDTACSILEPTPGKGNLVKAIKKKLPHSKVTAPDDFFLLTPRRFDCVVMNPPFSSRYAFMENAPDNFNHSGMKLGYWMLTQCMLMSDRVIALMPWFTVSDSDLRLQSLMRYGMKSITALPRKTFSYARIQTVVLELVRGYKCTASFRCYDQSYRTPLL